MLSLYDYLGKAAGSDLGKHVADFASTRKSKITTREIQTPRYNGKILMYEESLLDEFFTLNPQFGSKSKRRY